MYEDATELQVFFVTQRDVLCKDGQTFMSPALNYTKRLLVSQIDEEKKMKQNTEENDDEKAGMEESKKQANIDDILVITNNFFTDIISLCEHPLNTYMTIHPLACIIPFQIVLFFFLNLKSIESMRASVDLCDF